MESFILVAAAGAGLVGLAVGALSVRHQIRIRRHLHRLQAGRK